MRWLPETNYPGPWYKDPMFWTIAGYTALFLVTMRIVSVIL